MTGLGLADVVALLLLLALNAYVLTGGADFGGGVWDLLARGPRRDKQRRLIASAIGPIWEANHVWLIIAVVICFTAFPPAFALLGTVLHVPLALMLLGVICRGSAFVFRSYGSSTGEARHRWGLVFAIASTLTPILLGAVLGAIALGTVGQAATRVGSASFAEVFVLPWLAPFPLLAGGLTLLAFAYLAAVYLCLAAREKPLREDFRLRALWSGGLVLAVSVGALAVFPRHVFQGGALGRRGTLLLEAVTLVATLAGLFTLWRRRYRLARLAAGAQISLLLWGWAAGQYPYLVPPTVTIRQAAAPAGTLELLLGILAGGGLILSPSLAWLLRLFARRESR
jgi:cytochrome d ubiquinol oxidase subunit II